MNNNRAYVITDDINALAYTGNYTTSPFFWGEKYESAYSEMYARTYILVGTGTAITSGTISFEDLLQNSNVPSSGGVTITSKLYGVPSSAVSGSFVTLSACTLLNTGTHTANYVSYSSYPVRTLNTTTLSYGV